MNVDGVDDPTGQASSTPQVGPVSAPIRPSPVVAAVADLVALHRYTTSRFQTSSQCSCEWVDMKGWTNPEKRWRLHVAAELAAAGLLVTEMGREAPGSPSLSRPTLSI